MLFETVCLATDFSPVSARAADYILRLTDAGCRKVILLHVHDATKEQMVISEPPGLDDELAPAYEETLRERLHRESEQLMVETVRRFREVGIAVEPVIISGNPADEIVRVAETRGVSLIVVGAHGRTTLGQAFLGSVSSDVIRRTGQPVLVIRGSQEK